jgi:cyclopropane fatty-acyl-phospholipid synthase-like methyltransferase
MAGPDLLDRLMTISRNAFGAWDEYCLYPIMYPWVAARLDGLAPGSRVLDIGAGVSPLPLFAAECGLLVDCVDRSPILRTLPLPEGWNGWGFFDYSHLNRDIAAHNCAIEEFQPSHSFDAIYSAGCIAHVARAVREDTFRRCRQWLRSDGIMLHAIELIPSSDFVWNRCEGREVEPPVRHGTVNDVVDWLTALGFQINERRVVRAIPEARTDLLLIDCSVD